MNRRVASLGPDRGVKAGACVKAGLVVALLLGGWVATAHAQATHVITTVAQPYSPVAVTTDGSGNMYISESAGHRVLKVTSSGVVTALAGTGTAGYSGDGAGATYAQLNTPWSVAADAAGNVYVADSENHRVRKIAAATGLITTVAGTGTAGYSGDGGAATAAQVSRPRGVSVDASGNVYIADFGNHRIRRLLVAAGTISTVAGNGTPAFAGDGGAATAASLHSPTDVTVNSAGDVFIADTSNSRIRKVASGIISTVAGNGTTGAGGDGGAATSAQLNYPWGVAVDAAGIVYIADTYNHRIRKVTSGLISTAAGTGVGGFSGDGGPATAAQLYSPYDVHVRNSTTYLIADYAYGKIRQVASGGAITGSVTVAATGAPLAGVPVWVHNSSGGSAGSVTTDAAGAYLMTGLTTGTYYVRTANTLGYVDELYNNLPCPGGGCSVTSGTGVSVAAGSATSGINFGLAQGGSISGTVTNASTGAPLGNVSVHLYSASNAYSGSGYTNAAGVYTSPSVAPGTYYVKTSNNLGYIDELYDNQPCPGGSCALTGGTGVSVSAGSTTGGINIGLTLGGSITGTVTNAATGSPISGVYAYVYASSGSYVGYGYTNASGVYTAGGLLPGTYYVRTYNSLGYVDELYNNVPCPGGACTLTTGTPVSVTTGSTTGGINVSLAVGGSVAGTVTSQTTGAPLSGVYVYLYNASGTYQTAASTSANGAYTMSGLAPGTYYLLTSNSLGYLDELYYDTLCISFNCTVTWGTPITVTAGSTRSGVDFALTLGGTITGSVTASATGAPLSGVTVYLHNSSGTLLSSVTTNASGVYTKSGLAPGTYYVRTSNSLGYLDELYNNLPCYGGSCTVTTGTGVAVAAAATTSGINFSLAVGGTVTGTVTAAGSGAPLSGVNVYVYSASGSYVGYGTSNTSGVYSKSGLAPGTYYLRAYDTTLGYIDELYNDIPCPGHSCPAVTSGTGVPVTADATTSGIDFALTLGGILTGVVTDSSTGALLANVSVTVYNSSGYSQGSVTTNASGVYTKNGLATGTYYVRTWNSLGYVDELYNNIPCSGGMCPTVTTGGGVPVTAGATVNGISFGLQMGGTITGTVTSRATGAALGGIPVTVYDANGKSVGGATTNGSGVYSKSGLLAGAYYVRTTNTSGWVDQLYDLVYCPGGICPGWSLGSRVLVESGVTTTHINFALVMGGTVTGTVTNASTGAPTGFVAVAFFDAAGAHAGTARANASGVYSMRGLPTGTYYLRTEHTNGFIDELYSDQPCPDTACTVTAGTGVDVTAGSTTPGINMALTPGGVLTGTVRAAGTGSPIAGVRVSAYYANGLSAGGTSTDASGVYTIGGLATGTYYALTENSLGYIDELYARVPCAGSRCAVTSGTPVGVTAGTTRSGIDFELMMGGTIAGTVTAAGAGAPIAGVQVRAYNSTGKQVGSAATDASGAYAVRGLGTGIHYVKTLNGLGYVDELYDNLACPSSSCTITTGTGVPVVAGATSNGINFALAVGGSITGTATDATSGALLANVDVRAYNASRRFLRSAVTDASGAYAITGLPAGTHYVHASDAGAYIDELYNDVSCPALGCALTDGASVSVTLGAVTGTINFALTPGGSITGAVADAVTGAPLAGVFVDVSSTDGTYVGSAETGASGSYTVRGLPAGNYHLITVNMLGYLDELYDGVPCADGGCDAGNGQEVTVAAGATTAGIDFALARGGTITGTITSTASGAPIIYVYVQVHDANGAYVAGGTTNASGIYTVAGLPSGSYRVVTSNTLGYVDELYNNVPCPAFSCAIASGSSVGVTAGTTTGGVNFSLATGGGIAGTVTDAGTSRPITGARAWVLDAYGRTIGTADTNGSGDYAITGLPVGVYRVRAATTAGHVDEQYDNLPCPGGSCALTAGADVTVAPGQTTQGIHFSLTMGGAIAGAVTNAGTALPMANVPVTVNTTAGQPYKTVLTNSSGQYTASGLGAGTYYVRTATTQNYVNEIYSEIACPACTTTTSSSISVPSGADVVTVTAGTTTGGIDFGLLAGGTIAGAVTDAGTGAPLENVPVTVHDAAGASLKTALTSASGAYSVPGLPTGTYYVRTVATQLYANEIYAGVECPGCGVTTSAAISIPSGATGIGLSAGTTVSGINLGLARLTSGARGDFTGDMKSDVLWRHSTRGEVWLWPMNGSARVGETYVRTIGDTNWEIRGQGDQDGDGDADLLWRNKVTGEIYFWPMNGSVPAAEIYVGMVDPAYDIVGVGDFDGDGKSDILWRHLAMGDVWIWLMDGPTPVSQVFIARVDPGYVVKGVGDFDGDRKADIVWHHATLGEVWVWPMNGTSRLSEAWVATVPDTQYQIQAVADFTGDGKADLVWWHATLGEVWMWPMNGPVRLAETWVATVPDTAYRIAGAGDYNGDGKADLLWHHAWRGEVWVWIMNGSVRLSETWVGTVGDTGYEVVQLDADVGSPPDRQLHVTLAQGLNLSGPYAARLTGPNGFVCVLRQDQQSVSCPMASFPHGTSVSLLLTITAPDFANADPFLSTAGCDTLTINTCGVVMDSDRSITIRAGKL